MVGDVEIEVFLGCGIVGSQNSIYMEDRKSVV